MENGKIKRLLVDLSSNSNSEDVSVSVVFLNNAFSQGLFGGSGTTNPACVNSSCTNCSDTNTSCTNNVCGSGMNNGSCSNTSCNIE